MANRYKVFSLVFVAIVLAGFTSLGSATVVIDDNFDDGSLATNTGGTGAGFIGHGQDQVEAGPPFVANPHEAGGLAVLESDPDGGFSISSIVSNDVFTLDSNGHLIEFFYADLFGTFNLVGVADQSYNPGPSFGGAPFHPAFNPPGGLFVDADATGLVGGAVSILITDSGYSVNGGALQAHSLGASTVRVAASFQGPVDGGLPSSSDIDRIRVNSVPEPSAILLVILGSVGIAGQRYRRRSGAEL